MKSEENGQWHRDVGDYSPGPDTEEMEMVRSDVSSGLLKSVDCPQSDVDDNQEGYELLAGLLRRRGASSPSNLGCKQIYQGII